MNALHLLLWVWSAGLFLWLVGEILREVRRMLEPTPDKYVIERDGDRVFVRLPGIEARVK